MTLLVPQREGAGAQAMCRDAASGSQQTDGATIQRLQDEVQELQQQLRQLGEEAAEQRRRHTQEQQQARRQAEADAQHAR